jgi:hypothetical protein
MLLPSEDIALAIFVSCAIPGRLMELSHLSGLSSTLNLRQGSNYVFLTDWRQS